MFLCYVFMLCFYVMFSFCVLLLYNFVGVVLFCFVSNFRIYSFNWMSAKHNLLFYSSHPNDQLSKQILQELNKNPLLKEQYLTN